MNFIIFNVILLFSGFIAVLIFSIGLMACIAPIGWLAIISQRLGKLRTRKADRRHTVGPTMGGFQGKKRGSSIRESHKMITGAG